MSINEIFHYEEIIISEEMKEQEATLDDYWQQCQVCDFRAFIFRSMYYERICALCFAKIYSDCVRIPHKYDPTIITCTKGCIHEKK